MIFPVPKDQALEVLGTLKKMDTVIGVLKEQDEILDEDIDRLIQERQDARKAKNFARSDEIRNLLAEKGIILEDTKEGVRWKRR